MKYLVIDGELNSTGIRDYYEASYLDPEDLNLSDEFKTLLKSWLEEYFKERYSGFKDSKRVNDLDNRGIELAKRIKKELIEVKVQYYSEATGRTTLID